MSRLIAVLVLACAFTTSSAGRCPNVAPMPDFYMEGMLGRWYTIQKTEVDTDCLTTDITVADARKGHYDLIENSPSKGLVNAFGLGHEHTVKFRLQTTSSPAVFDLSIPVLVSYKTTILDTDYHQYAVVVSCNKRFSLLGSGTVVTVLSRTPTIDATTLEKIHSKLLAYSINTYAIPMINHQCSDGTKDGVIIKTASNIFDTFKHSVDVIADGIGGAFHPKRPSTTPKPKVIDEEDPSVTGEYNIDIRSSLT
ncbi:hypothetical protein FQR65_LT12568 [Abscondita terminalis]|nr:hypothetical protein FQR65_LT12568 [Abscondita terminalis]